MSAQAKPKCSPQRAKLIAQVHMGTARLFGRNDEDTHADYIEKQCGKGKRSCNDLTDLELEAVAKALRKSGALDGDGRSRGGNGPNRPTREQWAKLARLARLKGWDGLEDESLQKFVCHTAKVTSSRFLTKDSITLVITGLEKWVKQLEEE